jgi:isoleucyl-tRNA synthetase
MIDSGKAFPADFIAEGVDQTRGWFFTLHAISTMVFDSVAFKNVVSNGLVLDKNGNKMSKRLGNAVDPFDTLGKYGPDATRWYMIGNAQPWDNLKFNVDGITEVQRKFFGTLYNTYAFFALYANIDGFRMNKGTQISVQNRPEIDRWILSRLNSLKEEVQLKLEDYDPTPAVRAIEEFVTEQLSNWYVRLGRRRFWRSESDSDKQAAYETLFECLETVSQLMSPVAPFFAEWLYRNLNAASTGEVTSVHLSNWPKTNTDLIDTDLEERMELAQRYCSMILALRKKVNIRVRQPLQRIMVPIIDPRIQSQLNGVKDLILSETNVKELVYVGDDAGMIEKKIKPDFKVLGPKFGKLMKSIAAVVITFDSNQINTLQRNGELAIEVEGQTILLHSDDVEIFTEDIPGWLVASEGAHTVALDVTLSEELLEEGLAREIVNKIQGIRKSSGLEVTDSIEIVVGFHPALSKAIENNKSYICAETLGASLTIVNQDPSAIGSLVEITDEISVALTISKLN